MRTKVVSFFIFFQELSNKKKIKALRPKMTKIASRGSCLNRFIDKTAINRIEVSLSINRSSRVFCLTLSHHGIHGRSTMHSAMAFGIDRKLSTKKSDRRQSIAFEFRPAAARSCMQTTPSVGPTP